MQLSPGEKLGPYEILSLIGSGGMGEVYKAHDPRLCRDVAIKVSTQQFNWRFEREARAVAALNHPNICQVHDIGPNYLVMEYIEGAPPRGPLAPAEAVKLALAIAAGLEAAHGKGIVHRDLKPANILVTQSGSQSGVKLLDFGLALIRGDEGIGISDDTVTGSLSGATAAGTILGTAGYMSPEQAQGKTADVRSDIFSFGLVLYELLSGRRAFARDSVVETMAAIIREEPAPLNAPARLVEIVARCLRKAPEARFQTIHEVRAALEHAGAAPADEIRSIAVLPFANMSADKENEYFSDGLSEEIISVLAQIPGLKVIARTSAFAFRGKEQDIRKIAEALGVRTVLEGSVRRVGNRIRVTAQLIGAGDGTHLWSERFDRELADIFAVQDEIAASIATALRMKLAVQPAQNRQFRPNLPAYEALLRGRYQLYKVTQDSMAKARECLAQAIALDPAYALPHSELGFNFITLATFGMLPAHQAVPLIRAAVEKAHAIDPSLADALAMLGWIAATYDYDWPEAERLFRLARAHEPVTARVRILYGEYLRAVGKADQAVEELRSAIGEDPLNPLVRVSLAVHLLAAAREKEAERECLRVLELDENYYPAHLFLSMSLADQGKLEEAIPAAERAHALAPWNRTRIGYLAGLLRLAGDKDRAVEVLAKIGDGTAYDASLGFAFYHLVCSEIDQAADWAAKAIEQRHPAILLALQFPLARELRASSRWPDLAKTIHQSAPLL